VRVATLAAPAVVGPDIRAGPKVHSLIFGNRFHTARIIGKRNWFLFLGGEHRRPGRRSKQDVEFGDANALWAVHPDVAAETRSFPVLVATNELSARGRASLLEVLQIEADAARYDLS